ncbi:hypothetical protein OUZ56_030238 [Daphnia magna]|uniref:Uncharacterized protein n=1 Tax=Daphnia magna TaxID=35525 RepID=A0ABQ9ZQP5_9CRUS|nr:hypothetical protein OUZ56_030238 [Daphnia magna]
MEARPCFATLLSFDLDVFNSSLVCSICRVKLINYLNESSQRGRRRLYIRIAFNAHSSLEDRDNCLAFSSANTFCLQAEKV